MLEKYLPANGFSVSVLPFHVVRHLPQGIAHVAYFFRSLKMTRRADIVYAQDAISVGWPAYLAALIMRKPFVVKIVGDHVWEQGRQRFGVTQELDAFPFWPTHPYLIFLRLLQQMVVRSARTIIVPSVYLKNVVSRWGISPERISVVYNGIEIPVPTTSPTTSIEHPLIVSIGRLVSWKGFEGVIDAIKGEPWHLVIVGDGPLRASLESHAHAMSDLRSRSLGGRVHFMGLLPRPELHGWLKIADVFVSNSTYEGLPHTLIEAMSLGTPVIATNIAGNREVMTDGKEGLLVPTGNGTALHDAIKKTLSDSETKRRVVAAQERARAFSVEETINGLARVLKTICPVSRISA